MRSAVALLFQACLLFVTLAGSSLAADATVLLPRTRAVYYSSEPIVLAIANVPEGRSVVLRLVPAAAGSVLPLQWTVTAPRTAGSPTVVAVSVPPPAPPATSPAPATALDPAEAAALVPAPATEPTLVPEVAPVPTATASFTIPGGTLAPAAYVVELDGLPSGVTLTVVDGVRMSSMRLSQTSSPADTAKSGGNFLVSNAFSFGLYDRDGSPLKDLRGRRSPGMQALENAMTLNQQSLIYMYWTGYVTHKPWGAEKSWAEPSMVQAMRLLNLSTAQRLRRYEANLMSIGTLDEPGLSWGPTPAGGMASGFPNWDEQAWYEARGWTWTPDPASRPADDWRRYMAIRCAILRENNAWARSDIKSILPTTPFSTDLYAPAAIMDGTDPMNQQVNDIPSTHVFLDWGTGKLGVIGSLYLEKSHDPTAKIAHAMNGQLFGARVPQPQQGYAYRLMMNGMLAAGLHSNWWLNYGGMSLEALKTVHDPVLQYGGLFDEMTVADHDVAVLWSDTEIILREQEVTAREATKTGGEQIKLMVAALPENSALESNELVLSAYNVGGNYRDQVLLAHQALNRAGYPAHVVHEQRLPSKILANYKVLVIVGQTHPFPADVRAALDAFVRSGGKIVVDPTTTVELPGAVRAEVDLKDPQFRWATMFQMANSPEAFKTRREASYFQTNSYMDAPAIAAVPGFKAAMAKTAARQVMTTDSTDLGCERHVAGDGALVMVLNAREALPDNADDDPYFIYNYAPTTATYSLPIVMQQQGSGLMRFFSRNSAPVVFQIDGGDWRHVTRIEDPVAPITGTFEPGEMKLYLVAPRLPKGLKARIDANPADGTLAVRADLDGLDMPWPLIVELSRPDGTTLYHVSRATNAKGHYEETFPVGRNVSGGMWAVKISSPVGGIGASAFAKFAPTSPTPATDARATRILEPQALDAFLATKPSLTIAVGGDPGASAAAQQLQSGLTARGVICEVVAEDQVLQKVRYPRVFDPVIRVYVPSLTAKPDPDPALVQARIQVESEANGNVLVRKIDGSPTAGEWFQPQTLVTVTGDFIDLSRERFYAAGCVFYIDAKQQIQMINGDVVKVQATAENRERWSRPWYTLQSFVGTDKLTPQLPEAYSTTRHLVVIGDSTTSDLAAILQASELPLEYADAAYPGPGRALVSFLRSPFAVDRHVVLIGAHDAAGMSAGVADLLSRLK